MACTCTSTKKIAPCLTNLEMGTVSPTDTAMYVYIKRHGSAERIERISTTTDGSGTLTPDLSGLPEGFLSQNFEYEIWATEQANDIEDRETITLPVGSVNDNCYCLNFNDIWIDDDKQSYATQQLQSA